MDSQTNFPLAWSGAYEYDFILEMDYTPPAIAFRLELQFSNDVDFTGHVRESSNSPMPELGVINGKLENDKITFVKSMPVATLLEFDGSSTKMDCDHPPIHYEGEYVREENLLVGHWIIPSKSTGVFEQPPTTGTWYADAEMER